MDEKKYSFYLQKNNTLFKGSVLTVCYQASKEEVKKYALTSPNIVLFIKNDKIDEFRENVDCNYFEEIKKMFLNRKIILRLQSECFLGMYGDSHCDCESQRINAINIISKNDGIFIHMPQEAQGWGLFYKLSELELQVSGHMPNGEYVGKKDRDSAQKLLLNSHDFCDNRGYEIVHKILSDLGLENHEYLVITDSDKKINQLKKNGMSAIKFSEEMTTKMNNDNLSEYLIKILNSTHNYDNETVDEIVKIMSRRDYNERTLLTFISIIDKIKNDKTYVLNDDIKNKLLSLYDNIICGEEKRYIIGDEKYVKIQNNFSCKVDSTIFKTLCNIYGKGIFDRISLEKIYYFKNVGTTDYVRVRSSKILDNIEEKCQMFNGQIYIQQSSYDEDKKKIVQNSISSSSLRSYFENPLYHYQKRIEMITTISEGQIPGLHIYIKRIPNMENRVMDIYGKSEDIKNLINKITQLNSRTLLNVVSDKNLSDQNFSQYNLRFADLNSVIDEELNMYKLTKESELNGVRGKILLRDGRDRENYSKFRWND